MTPATCSRCDRPPYRGLFLCRECLEAVIYAAPEPRSRRLQDALNAQRTARVDDRPEWLRRGVGKDLSGAQTEAAR